MAVLRVIQVKGNCRISFRQLPLIPVALSDRCFMEEKFEIWTKEKMKKGQIALLGDMKFKVLKCTYLPKEKCYAVLCLCLKKIALLTPTFHSWSGVDKLTEQRAKEFSGIGHDITIFTSEESIR